LTTEPDEVLWERALGTIDRNARKQSQLIEDLLDISRASTGQFRLDVRPIRLPNVIESAIDSVRPAITAKALRLREKIDVSTDVVMGDERRLQQVIWNLLSNAVKFTPEGVVS
jgi:signal transduction histidine kinase